MNPRPTTAPTRAQARSGFTLFEVGISLLLVAFGVVSVLMVFPVGIKQTQASKFKILAAAKAVEMIDSFSGSIDEVRMLDAEVPEPWEGRSFAYTNNHPDLEQKICNFRYGIQPLPIQIARRFDSDGEEIQRILDDGGYLYYAMPQANSNLDERWQSSAPPNEARCIVFAVVGSAQHNAIPRLPQKAWPYRYPYPSPPLHMIANNGTDYYTSKCLGRLASPVGDMISGEWWLGTGLENGGSRLDHVLTTTINSDFKQMYSDFLNYAYCGGMSNQSNIPADKLKNYLASTITYCRNLVTSKLPPIMGVDGQSEWSSYFVPTPSTSSQSADASLHALGLAYDQLFAQYCASGELVCAHPPVKPHANPLAHKDEQALITVRVAAALRVQAMRYLAQAFTCLYQFPNSPHKITGAFHIRDINASTADDQNPTQSPAIAALTLSGIIITPSLIRYLHERSKAMVMRYTTCFPYDWGQPRPVERATMMDFPLIELDMFSPPRTGRLGGTINAAQWRPVSAQPISNLGPSIDYPGQMTVNGDWIMGHPPYPEWDDVDQSFWGNPDHFTLTKKFDPCERCRQLVFWSVDWQMYEDFELAPSAPMDASRYPFTCPRDGDQKNLQNRLTGTTAAFGGQTQYWRMSDNYSMLNPELRVLIRDPALYGDPDPRSMPSGTDIANAYVFPKPLDSDYQNSTRQLTPKVASSQKSMLGMFGADRNFNRVLDRGPLSSSKRLRAALVARFHFYDPRIPLSLR